MAATERMVVTFTSGLGGSRNREVFQLLEAYSLRPLGKTNTETLLFQYLDAERVMHDILAFRLGPPCVMSFPKSYRLARSAKLYEHLENFIYLERPVTTGPVSDSQYSTGQIEMNRATHERIIEVCKCVCDDLD